VLPKPHAEFLATWDINKQTPKISLVVVLIAIFVGALSHNFIDSFTHESGLSVTMFPILSSEVFSIRGEPYPVFRLLQYSGSALGMAMILGAYWFAFRRHCRSGGLEMWQDPRRWLLLLGLTSVTILVAACLNARLLSEDLNFYTLRVFGFRFLITWIPLFGLAFLCLAIVRGRSDSSREIGKGKLSARYCRAPPVGNCRWKRQPPAVTVPPAKLLLRLPDTCH